MKYRIIFLLLFLAAVLLPTQGKEVGKLIPAAVLSVRFDNQDKNVAVQTDSGNSGVGETLNLALQDLQRSAPGEVLLNTIEYVLVTDTARGLLPALKETLRPNVRVCRADEEIDLEAAWQYLRVHMPLTRISNCTEETALQLLTWEEERFHLEDRN